jgi:pimeloyl-ACP methyl ester carboxylesterase
LISSSELTAADLLTLGATDCSTVPAAPPARYRVARVRIRLDGLDAYYEESGSGTPLILVHGLGGSRMTWQRVVGALAKSFRVIAYDLRGLGRSRASAAAISLEVLVADLHGLVEGLELDGAVLVGHSLGGAVALAYAAEHPERVSAVVGVSAPSFTPPEQAAWLVRHAESAKRDGMDAIAEAHAQNGLPETFRKTHPDDVAAYKRVIAGSDRDGFAAICAVIGKLDLRNDLDRIRAPVLLVHGELDQVVPADAARATASRLASCEYVELEGCGHVVPFERPHDLVALVRDFVSRSAETSAIRP